MLALFLGRGGRFGEAAEAFAEILAIDPGRASAHMGRLMALLLGGRDAEAAGAARQASSLVPAAPELKHLEARLLAASTDAEVRDGARAHRLAREVYAASPTPEHAQTVAMALAELGRFDEAAQWQRQVVAELEQSATEGPLEQARRRLRSYVAGAPCRAPWLDGPLE
jgi:Flp pilus assembly protein TadD